MSHKETVLGTTDSCFLLQSVSKPSEEEDDNSESDPPLDVESVFDVGFTGRVRVMGRQHPSGSPVDCKLKPLDYSAFASADSIVFQ